MKWKLQIVWLFVLAAIACNPGQASLPPLALTGPAEFIPLCPSPPFPHGNPFLFLKNTPLADGFQLPVGPPSGRGYYNAQPFRERDFHLGEDWNGTGGGDTDLGLPVFVVANGIVFFAEDIFGGWGKVVRILHKVDEGGRMRYYESLYAHCDTILVAAGDSISRGQHVANIGNAHGLYFAHLHLEIMDSLGLSIGNGYGVDTSGYRDPSHFIRSHSH